MDPFIGQIVMFGGNFAPRGWALCDGQLLAISSHSALFSILGTTYGGDGRTTFALPDLRGRAPIHAGRGPGLSDRRLGAKGGEETVTLSVAQLPSHNHATGASDQKANTDVPGIPARAEVQVYTSGAANKAGAPTQNAGGSQPVDNMQPFQCVNFIIALEGVYPSRG